MELIRLFCIGIAVGIANVMPGVSGGTIAVVFGIYDRFVKVITLNLKKLWNNKGFIIPLVAGMACGILIFSKVITYLFEHFPKQTNFFFLGIIIGSIPMLYSYAVGRKILLRNINANLKNYLPKLSVAVCFAAGLILMLVFIKIEGSTERTRIAGSSLPVLTSTLWLKLFAAGIIGAIVMIIPGISGSFFMLIMGIYEIVITSISVMIASLNDFNMFLKAAFILLPNGAGILIGLLGGAKIVSLLLEKAKAQTYGVILGLITGSAINIYPGFYGCSISGILTCLLCICTGFFTAYLSSKKTDQNDSGDDTIIQPLNS